MTFKLQAQSGSCRRSMWCGAAEHTGMPSPSEQDDWGACTFFGTVPLLPLARVDGYGVAQPCLAAVIEGGQRHCNSEAYATPSDLSRSFTLPANASACMRNMDLNQQVSPIGRYGNADDALSGQRSKRGAPYGVSCGRERDKAYRPVSAYNTAPHCPRHHGNPCAEGAAAPSPAKQRCHFADKSPWGFSQDRRSGQQTGNANHHRLQCASGH